MGLSFIYVCEENVADSVTNQLEKMGRDIDILQERMGIY